jgi:hypothetical protein
MNLIKNYTDEQILGLIEGLTSELAARQREQEENQKNRVKITVTFNELAAVWKYQRTTAKIFGVAKFVWGDWEIYACTFRNTDGGAILGWNKYNSQTREFLMIPNEARQIKHA